MVQNDKKVKRRGWRETPVHAAVQTAKVVYGSGVSVGDFVLEEVFLAYEKAEGLIKWAGPFWLTVGFVCLMLLGAVQDIIHIIPFFAALDVFMLSFDEMLVGAVPTLILSEVVSRTTGSHPFDWFRNRMYRLPAIFLPVFAALITLLGSCLDFSVVIPVPGLITLTWPPEFLDSLVVGPLMLLLLLEMHKRRVLDKTM